MDMSTMTTSTAAAATSTATSSMDTSMDMGTCVTSMLWNWQVIDACFISESWHITSKGMFAGSCIGVILLVMSLEFLRRISKEYDRYIIRQFQRAQAFTALSVSPDKAEPASSREGSTSGVLAAASAKRNFRPNLVQQMIRATLHMLQFTVAYFIMLLAMYYNGYLIICIIIGAWLGGFVFSWETVEMGGPQEEATVCCG